MAPAYSSLPALAHPYPKSLATPTGLLALSWPACLGIRVLSALPGQPLLGSTSPPECGAPGTVSSPVTVPPPAMQLVPRSACGPKEPLTQDTDYIHVHSVAVSFHGIKTPLPVP